MRIPEITKIHNLSSPGIEFSNLTQGVKDDFTVDGFSVYKYEIGHQIVFIVKDEEDIVSSLVLDKDTFQGKDIYVVTRVFTEGNYRGKGIAIKLLVDVQKKYDFRLRSDRQLSDDGVKMWLSLMAYNNVKMVDLQTGDIAGYEDVKSAGKLYTKNPEYVFIVEDRKRMAIPVNPFGGSNLVECKSIFKSHIYMYIDEDQILKNV